MSKKTHGGTASKVIRGLWAKYRFVWSNALALVAATVVWKAFGSRLSVVDLAVGITLAVALAVGGMLVVQLFGRDAPVGRLAAWIKDKDHLAVILAASALLIVIANMIHLGDALGGLFGAMFGSVGATTSASLATGVNLLIGTILGALALTIVFDTAVPLKKVREEVEEAVIDTSYQERDLIFREIMQGEHKEVGIVYISPTNNRSASREEPTKPVDPDAYIPLAHSSTPAAGLNGTGTSHATTTQP